MQTVLFTPSKHFAPTVGGVGLLLVIFDKAVQLEYVLALIEVTSLPMVKEVNEVFPVKGDVPCDIFLPIYNVFMGQLEKQVLFEEVVNVKVVCASAIVTFFNCVQPSNTPLPIDVTFAGILTLVNLMQPEKAF